MTDPFVGAWSIARSIADLGRSTTIECSGSAALRRVGEGLRYDEAVTFMTEGRLIRATRAYRYSFAQGAIVATFADGTPFFSTYLDALGVGTATHRCGDDLYELTLTLRAPQTWTTIWSVGGTKRLRIMTRYERQTVQF